MKTRASIVSTLLMSIMVLALYGPGGKLVAAQGLQQTTTNAQVDARQVWQSTGLTVAANTTITFQVVSGQWTYWAGQVPYNSGEGDGYLCPFPPDQCSEPLPTFSKGALIGKIGTDIFGIGKQNTIVAQQSGTLYLRINDDDGGLYDNDGILTVSITMPSPATIGGTWISPNNNFRIEGKILQFSAHANSSTGVKYVNFTAMWPGSGRIIACTAKLPTSGDIYTCAWPLGTPGAGVPNGGSGPITVSFDVYDQAGDSRLSPDGTRREGTIWNAPMIGWQLMPFCQPWKCDHTKRDLWAVDLTSSNPAVYPTLPGKVVFGDRNCSKAQGNTFPSCYGNVVVIDHENGLYSIYTHLFNDSFPKCGPKPRNADCGKTVGITDRIGTMSNSGTTDVHLHFAVRAGIPNLGANALFGSDTPVRTPLVP